MSSLVKSAKEVMKGGKGVSGISPDRQRAIRNRVSKVVVAQLPNVKKVLDGELQWTAAQVNLFRALLNKCIADQTAPKEDDSGGTLTLGEMTPEQFTRELQKASDAYLAQVEGAKIIDHE